MSSGAVPECGALLDADVYCRLIIPFIGILISGENHAFTG
jgi:hypothetical protein